MPEIVNRDLTGQWTKLAADGSGSGAFGDLVTVRHKGRIFIADIDAINYADPPGTPPKRSTIHGEVRPWACWNAAQA